MASWMLMSSLPVQASEQPITIHIDGEKVSTDVDPVLLNGTTLVPIRVISEALGAEVEWIPEQQKVIIEKGKLFEIEIVIDQIQAQINGKKVDLLQKAQIMSGRTMVPLRFVAEGFASDVDWNQESRTVEVARPPQELELWLEQRIASKGVHAKPHNGYTYLLASYGEQQIAGKQVFIERTEAEGDVLYAYVSYHETRENSEAKVNYPKDIKLVEGMYKEVRFLDADTGQEIESDLGERPKSVREYEGTILTVEASKAKYHQGEPVLIEAVLENRSDKTIPIYSVEQILPVYVYHPNDFITLPDAEGQEPLKPITELAPGETIKRTVVWDQMLPDGTAWTGPDSYFIVSFSGLQFDQHYATKTGINIEIE